MYHNTAVKVKKIFQAMYSMFRFDTTRCYVSGLPLQKQVEQDISKPKNPAFACIVIRLKSIQVCHH